MEKPKIDIQKIADYKPLLSDQLLHYSQEILVMQYKFGEPFPGLVYELKDHPILNGGTLGSHGVIHSMRDGYIVAFNGQKLEMRMYGQDLMCYGRLLQGYSEIK